MGVERRFILLDAPPELIPELLCLPSEFRIRAGAGPRALEDRLREGEEAVQGVALHDRRRVLSTRRADDPCVDRLIEDLDLDAFRIA